MMTVKVKAFTNEFSGGIAADLRSNVEVINPAGTSVEGAKCIGLWDTGATSTVIAGKIVNTLGLPATGITIVSGVGGSFKTTIHVIDLALPNGVIVSRLKVIKGILGDHFDVLIGMDIIMKGDLAISNFEGKSVFTYRLPSVARTDYARWAELQQQATSSKADRNAPCPCGSGRKYKHCCGK
jgi:hypothetical protein